MAGEALMRLRVQVEMWFVAAVGQEGAARDEVRRREDAARAAALHCREGGVSP